MDFLKKQKLSSDSVTDSQPRILLNVIKKKIHGLIESQFMIFSHTLFYTVLVLLFFSCQNDGKRNIEAYYYPVDEWKEGMVYEYHPVNNAALPVHYWYFRKLETDTVTYFTGQYYDHNFRPRQIFNAEIVRNGVFVNDYILYEYDSLGNVLQREALIAAAGSFPFEVKDSTELFMYKLKWLYPTEEYPDGYLEITRKRRFIGDTTYAFKGEPYDGVKFKMEELMDDFNDGHLEKEYPGIEIYAKNLGLIYYKKEIDENFVEEYELRDTFSMAKLEEKFKTYLSEDN